MNPGDQILELDDEPLALDAVFAFDRSMRSIDLDGHMHVECVNISKANVCPYMGSEIPNAAELGLDPTKIYMLYRDAAELEASAPTFENKQLMIQHVGVSANSPQEWLTVGVVSGVHWSPPYLKARLTVWNQKGIDAIESNAQSELSSGYRYKADMTSGIVDNVQYDGIMRQIVGNHVALVSEGRVGPDVFVTDEFPQEFQTMKIAALTAALTAAGMIATDAKPEDVNKLISATIAQDKKAKDEAEADKEACDAAAKEEGCDSSEMMKGEDGEWVSKAKDKAAKDKAVKDKAAKDAKSAKDKAAKDKKAKDSEQDDEGAEDIDLTETDRGSTKTIVAANTAADASAMDAAIATAVAAALAKDRALIAARADVQAVLGVVQYDSAEDVYGAALKHLKVDHEGVHPSAFRALFAASTKATRGVAKIVGDAATVQTMEQAFPGFDRLSRR